MTVAKVIEISASSTKSFEHAINEGIARASETVNNVCGAWVKEQKIEIENGKIVEYRVNLQITFILGSKKAVLKSVEKSVAKPVVKSVPKPVAKKVESKKK